MKILYSVLAVVCVVVILFVIIFEAHTMMWGKITLAFTVAFLCSSVRKLVQKK